MKVLKIITSRSITFNRFLLEISNSLSKRFIVFLCCKDPINIDNLDHLEREYIDFPDSFRDLLCLKKNCRMIKQIFKILNNSDIVYLHTPLAAHLVRLVNLFSFKKVKIIYHIHGLRYIPGEWSSKQLFYRLIEYILSFKTDKFIAINKLDYFSLLKFIPKNKVSLIKGVGVNLPSKFSIKKLPNSRDDFVVGVIGAFKKTKGYIQLINIAKICQKNPNIIFRVFGYGNPSWILELIKKEDITNIFIEGYVKNIEVEIDKFNLFMLPSHREGLNVSIQECLSRGIPVLTTTERGCKDLIIDGYNGFLYDKFDIQKGSEIILNISKMKRSDYSKLSLNSFKYAKKYLSRDIKNKEIFNIFKEYAV